MALHSNPLPDSSDDRNLRDPALVAAENLAPLPPEAAVPFGSQDLSREAFPSWSGLDVVAIICITLVTVFAFSLAALLVARSLPGYHNVPLSELATQPGVIISAQFAAYPVVIFCMFVLVRSRSRESFARALRWNWPGRYTLFFLAAGVLLSVLAESLDRILPVPKTLPIDKYFNDTTSAYLMTVFGSTLAPLLEELFFRGLLYPLLRRSLGVLWGVLLTALAFASIHGAQLGYAWAPLLSIFFVGVVFTLVREKTNSVAASFLMHCGYNLALFATAWFLTDHYRHLEMVLPVGWYR